MVFHNEIEDALVLDEIQVSDDPAMSDHTKNVGFEWNESLGTV